MDMLVNRPVAINDIVTIKLVSGEELVGKLLDQSADSVTIGKPIQISIQPVGKQVGLAFLPALGSVPEVASVRIPVISMSIRPVKTGDDVTRNYIQATSGIEIPPASSLINP